MSCFLPNKPVENEDIEKVLGKINNYSSRAKSIVLRNNKIKKRYYAINPLTMELTHTNVELVAQAILKLAPYGNFNLNDIECLCCGTSSPDLLLPGHALMVQGELGIPNCESVTTAGVCISGMTAFKYAYMNIASGISRNAVATGSELSSAVLRAKFYSENIDLDLNIETPNEKLNLEKTPELAFNADFLRWMLSDGAGAAFLSNQKNENGISLKIEWIENISYAGAYETCQYMGGTKLKDGSIVSWKSHDNLTPKQREYIMAIKQDVKLLNSLGVYTGIDLALAGIIEKRNLRNEDIDWFLPHYSSGYFKNIIYDHLLNINFEIPFEKWFTNLYEKGNTGSASIYIILEELFKSGKLEKGQKILCFIPESGRFSHCYMLLTVQ